MRGGSIGRCPGACISRPTPATKTMLGGMCRRRRTREHVAQRMPGSSSPCPSSERGHIPRRACHFPVSVSTNPSRRLSKIEIMERGMFFVWHCVFPHLLRMDSTEGHWHRLSWTYFVYLRELHCLKSTPIGHSILSNCSHPVRDWLGAEHPLPGGNFGPMGSGGQI